MNIVERLEALAVPDYGDEDWNLDDVAEVGRALPDLLKVARVAEQSVKDADCEIPEWDHHDPVACRETDKPREHWCLTCLLTAALEPLFRDEPATICVCGHGERAHSDLAAGQTDIRPTPTACWECSCREFRPARQEVRA